MSSFNYIVMLGRQPELGLAELESLLGGKAVLPFGREAALVDRAVEIDRLGGAQKVAQVLYRGAVHPLQELPLDITKLVSGEGKTTFGLSVYGGRLAPRAHLAAGLTLKKLLKPLGPVRLVTPGKGPVLSAAELRHNRVLDQGFELLVVMARSEMIIARTTGVQDIDWYSRRDYERPARSAKVGMLPPKLAQMLVNTTVAPAVADPFCGTGVVLQEARLLGREVTGSDLSQDMVEATRTNMAWLELQVPSPLPRWQATQADARTVDLPAESAVVSEGFLGPNLVQSPNAAQLAVIKSELLALYRECLRSWVRQLPVGGEVSICVPAWRVNRSWSYLGLVDELGELGYTLKGFKHVTTPLLYARDDQVVGRQLLLLRKK